MKPVRFFIDERDHKHARATAKQRGVPFSELVRDALLEKIERDRVLDAVSEVRNELDGLLSSLRDEQQRSRRELAEDAGRHLEQQRKDSAASYRKQEELTKLLISEIAKRFGGGGPLPGQRSTHYDPDSPPV